MRAVFRPCAISNILLLIVRFVHRIPPWLNAPEQLIARPAMGLTAPTPSPRRGETRCPAGRAQEQA